MKLFGLNQTRGFAERLAGHLGVALAAHEERNFADGEFKVRSLENVRGERVVVCQSLAADRHASANDKLIRLLFFCGALKDAAAAQVTVLAPYLAYWRKDRRTKTQDPITTAYVARLFEAVGVDVLITVDAHSIATFENAFRCQKDHLEAADVFAEHFAARLGKGERLVVVSPDLGGVHRARTFAKALAAHGGRTVELAFLEKQRSEGRVSGALFAGDVSAAEVIIYDDMLSTGGTIARAAEACAERGARAVHAAVTHGLFCGDAVAVLNGTGLASLAITDTVADIDERRAGLRTECHVLDSAALFARALERWPQAQ
jgi:ribose-phosphate pyrophosphokinase